MSLSTAEMCSLLIRPTKAEKKKKELKVFSLAGKREAVLVRLFELEK